MTSAHVATFESVERWDRASAVSDAATHLQDLILDLFRSTDDAQTLSGRESAFENRLRAALDELVLDEDQCAVSTAAVERALRLVRSLPRNVPIPDVAIDPDGEISLDWMPSHTRAFSISVGDSDRLAYAMMDGSDHAHGVFRFNRAISRPLLLQLAELTADADATVRVA